MSEDESTTDAQRALKQLCLDLSNRALALFDRIDERGLQAAELVATSDLRAVAVALDDSLRGAVAEALLDATRERVRRG